MTRKERVIRAPAATDIIAYEPLIPRSSQLGPLLELSREVIEQSYKFVGLMPGLRPSLGLIVRMMNAYYSFKIEGLNINPVALERAINYKYYSDPNQQSRIPEALLHSHTEFWVDLNYGLQDWRRLFHWGVVRNLYGGLFEAVFRDPDHLVLEKEFRDETVKVGRHMPPTPESVPKFVDRWSKFYSNLPDDPSYALIGIACAHHRLTWIHPFRDGNGRVTRLHTQAILYSLGLTQKVWSPTRGLAHRQDEYFDRLEDADEHRRGDYDGRGALSEQGLVRFVQFFLEVCLEQVDFMAEMLDQSKLNNRLEAWLCHEAAIQGSAIRREAFTPMAHIAEHGPITLTKFKAMTGLSEEPAEALLQALINQGLLCVEGLNDDVSIDVPFSKLGFVFPGLWPEAESDHFKG